MSKGFHSSLSCLAVFAALSTLSTVLSTFDDVSAQATPPTTETLSKDSSTNLKLDSPLNAPINAPTSPQSITNLIDRQESAVTLQQNLSAGSPVSNLEVDKLAETQNVAAVTSVSQLSDVRPTDWAFTALQSLVERYGCIAGYPDSTFRGSKPLARYEFAAGLNACLDKINEIISAGLADKVSKEDLASLKKLQEEFSAELTTLRGRVDALDKKVATIESQQFSTTTKLSGLALFNMTGATAGGDVIAERNAAGSIFATPRPAGSTISNKFVTQKPNAVSYTHLTLPTNREV